MKKKEFLKILEDNIKDYNKKVKFIFTSSYCNIECILTSIGIASKTLLISNYADEKDGHLCCHMVNKLQNSTRSNIEFLIYPTREKMRKIIFIDYKITVNETDNFIELIIQE